MQVHYFQDEKLTGISRALFESLMDFIRLVWDKSITKDKYLEERSRLFHDNPYAGEGGLPLALLAEDERVVGHVTSTPCKVWAQGRESLMYWNAGLYLLDECRGKGLGNVLPQKMIDTLPLVSGFFVVEQQLRTHTKMGWTIVGKVPEYMKVLNARNLFRNIDLSTIDQMPDYLRRFTAKKGTLFRRAGSVCFAAAISLYTALRKLSHPVPIAHGKMVVVDEFDQRIDALWNRVKYSIPCAQVRSAAYMNWQFKKEKGWIKLVFEVKGEAMGYALCAARKFDESGRMAGLRITSIIDILWDFQRPDIFCAMVEWIEHMARRDTSDALICSISNAQAQTLLRKNSFFRIPGTVFFAFHAADTSLHLSPHMEEWFITRGDADAAGSLGPQ